MGLWDEVRSSLSEWTATAAERGETMALVGMRQVDRYGIHRRLTREFAELGGQVHELITRGEAGPLAERESVQRIVQRIASLETELRAKDAEIAALRQKKRSTRGHGGPAEPGDSSTGGPASA